MIIRQLIYSALRKLGVYEPGEYPTAAEVSDALENVNRMLHSWSVDSNGVYTASYDEFTLSAGTQTYTYGSGGDFDAARPVQILSCVYRNNGIDFSVVETSRKNWMAIGQKDLESLPKVYLHEPEFPLAKIRIWPVPDDNYTVIFYAQKPLAQYTSSADDVGLPPEYEEAIEWNLAARIAPEYMSQIPQLVALMAERTYTHLQQYHAPPVPQVMTGLEFSGNYNIYEDE